MNLSRLVLLFSLGALFPACAKRVECVQHGGPIWRELKTSNFTLRTDLDFQEAQLALERMEHTRQAMLFFFEKTDTPANVEVTVLSSTREMEEFIPWVGGFTRRDARGLRLVAAQDLASRNSARALSQTQAHELAHIYTLLALPRMPLWLGEGLAEYLETAEVEDSKAVLGRAIPERIHALRRQHPFPLSEMWSWTVGISQTQREAERTYQLYLSAWAWVHFLINEEPDRFAEFFRLLSQAQEPQQAFNRAFAGLDPEVLRQRLERHLRTGQGVLWTVDLQPLPRVEAERALSPAEVHLIRLELTQAAPEGERQRLQAAEWKALETLTGRPDPRLLLAKVGAEKDAARRLASLEDLAGRYPDSADVLAALAFSHSEKGQRDLALKAAKRAWELEPDVYGNGYAWALTEAGRAQEALPLARRAVEASPWSAEVVDTLAAALAGTGRCAEAVATEKRAMDLLDHHTPPEERAHYEKALGQFEKSCRPRASSTAAQGL